MNLCRNDQPKPGTATELVAPYRSFGFKEYTVMGIDPDDPWKHLQPPG